jgi:hypothetical protein
MHWRAIYFSCLLCVMLAACAPVAALPTTPAIRKGIDPASPLAEAVLFQQCEPSGCQLYPLNPMAGEPVAGYEPLDVGKYAIHAFSPDGRTLAVLAYGDNEYLREGALSLVELEKWQPAPTGLTFDHASWLVFSPSGEQLLIGAFDQQMNPTAMIFSLVDVAQQKLLVQGAQGELPFLPRLIRYTPDGRGVMVYGYEQWQYGAASEARAHVALLDSADLSLDWHEMLDGLREGIYLAEPATQPEAAQTWTPAVVAAPDRAALYIVHADTEQMTTVDFVAQQAHTVEIAPHLTWLERLLALTARTAHAKVANGVSKQALLSADGKHLYVVGTTYVYTAGQQGIAPLDLQVLEVASGVERANLASNAESLALDSDGERLYLQGWNYDLQPYPGRWTDVIATDDLAVIAHVEDYLLTPTRRLDGRPILLASGLQQGSRITYAVLDPASLAVLHTWTDSTDGWWVLPER